VTAPATACPPSRAAAGKVRELRRAAGWSQRALAERAGISPCMVAMLESGQRNFTLPVLARVAAALGTSPAALMAGEEACPASLTAAWRVRALREGRGWTTEALAGKAGIPPGTLALLEAGQADLTLTALERLAGALETDITSLLAPEWGGG
jgi:transcriptional regulator with XRE-family HTH domain